MPDNRGMGVITMCDCSLPAKVYRVYPKFVGTPTPYSYFLGCRKTENRCRMVMWCKLRDRNPPEEDDEVEAYEHLVLRNMELEECIEDKEKEIEILRFQLEE
ncbi:hypothetical protein LINPERPRIM_LOCUS39079, partial [Linum perenne]